MAFLKLDPRLKRYKTHSVTPQQLTGLKQLVRHSQNVKDEFSVRAILWALDQSRMLTRRVAVCFSYDTFGEKSAGNIQDSVHDMNSCNGRTHIDYIFDAMGTEVGLSHHCGMYDADGKFDSKAPGRTIWVSHIMYDHDAEILTPPPPEELEVYPLPER